MYFIKFTAIIHSTLLNSTLVSNLLYNSIRRGFSHTYVYQLLNYHSMVPQVHIFLIRNLYLTCARQNNRTTIHRETNLQTYARFLAVHNLTRLWLSMQSKLHFRRSMANTALVCWDLQWSFDCKLSTECISNISFWNQSIWTRI